MFWGRIWRIFNRVLGDLRCGLNSLNSDTEVLIPEQLLCTPLIGSESNNFPDKIPDKLVMLGHTSLALSGPFLTLQQIICLCIILSEDRIATEFLLEGFLGLGFTTLADQELQLLDSSADPHPSCQQQKPSYHK